MPLVRRAAAGGVVVTESCVLGQKFGATDLLFQVQRPGGSCWVAVEIDGETHHTRAWGGGSLRQREQQDSSKDKEAWQRRLPLVRLHSADSTEHWEVALAAARQYAQQQLDTFILYGESHGKLSYGLTEAGHKFKLDWFQVRLQRLTGKVGACRQCLQSEIQYGPSTPSFQCTA